jgi:hypothetical protein
VGVPAGRRSQDRRVRALAAVIAGGFPPLEWLRQHMRRRHAAELEWRAQVRAQNVDNVNRLAGLSDAELIATNPGRANPTHEMELTRRLREAISDLTAETIEARRSADRQSGRLVGVTVAIAVMTGVLLALTVVLAVRS